MLLQSLLSDLSMSTTRFANSKWEILGFGEEKRVAVFGVPLFGGFARNGLNWIRESRNPPLTRAPWRLLLLSEVASAVDVDLAHLAPQYSIMKLLDCICFQWYQGPNAIIS